METIPQASQWWVELGKQFALMIMAILRKGTFLVVLMAVLFWIDKKYLKTIDILEVLKNDPKALALLIGLALIAAAFV